MLGLSLVLANSRLQTSLNMFNATQQSTKLTNLRMTLSKYGAKYLNQSPLEDAKSSDSETIAQEIANTHQVSPAEASNESMRYSPALPESRECGVSLHTLGSGGPPSINDEELRPQFSSDDESGLSVEEKSFLETASSIESVHTDSLGFKNIHSVSSLAESILFLDERNCPTSAVLSDLATRTQLPISSSTPSQSPVIISDEKCSYNLNLKSIESMPSACFVESSGQIGHKFADTDPKFQSDEDELKEPKQKKQKRFVRKSRSNVSTENEVRKSSFVTHESVEIDSMESTANAAVNNDHEGPLKYSCNSNELKVKSVAVQTLKSFSSEMRDCHSSYRKIWSAKPSRNVPVIKPTKLPSFLKESLSISDKDPVCSQDRGALCTVEEEISKLVSHHLQLTKDFLERQHSMYRANCKAVKLLERGQRERSDKNICKCVTVSSSRRKMTTFQENLT